MEHLEQAFVLQKTFVANASHELRTPITRMTIAAELALSQDREKKDYRQALSAVLDDAEKMEGIITGLVNLAQADLEFASSQLSPVRIDEILWAMQTEWKEKEFAELHISTGNLPTQEIDLTIMANPVLLQIALNNIVSNAFKFSGNKPVQCQLDILQHEIVISFKDQGIGIAEQELTEIFKPFFTTAQEHQQSGNGMGLYMAHKIISLYKGNISAMSQKGNGTTIIVVFPKL